MGKVEEEIKQKLKDLTFKEADVLIGSVISINEDLATCDVDIDGNTFFDVRLKSVIDDEVKGITVLPQKNSNILVQRIGTGNDFLALKYSNIDCIQWQIEDLNLKFTKEGFVFNDGENKGMVKLPELVQKINNIENKVNEIITWTATHTHTGVLAGGGTSGIAVGVMDSLTPTQENDLENNKIKH